MNEAEIRDLATRVGGMKALFSWRSPSAKPLKLDESSVTDDQLIALMLQEPRLIRRPIVRTPAGLLVQPDAAALAAALRPPGPQ
ncbi:MAG: arsenate reductase family protein [Dehalococcoidia bacterium]